ncbi:DNA polymerase IV [Pseudoxanthomonas winnipegensis]|uniref:DNA polymerase IV n=1 Tax=Pseudoxanthomonas winnipegensis TaxID=2480810 RepID=A0A4Q8LWR3_9GAMM|nr:DNA polymerase IV [Pseudoxanthomonas winnipegensis]TAA36796.1 DNA polymerase IV [Pseudoxanthomonas winnipegensis]
MRKILHIDMDAFYASVEQRDDPSLRGKPVVVAWRGARSVVCAASYEARVFGVRSAMPAVRAERLCPDAIFVPPDFTRYKAVSRQVREIFLAHTDLVEPLSLDEAYLDVTDPKIASPSATATAQAIRAQIFETTQLTASAGIAPNKFLAKIASDWNKPNGQYVIKPAQVEAFLTPLPVGRIPGVGKVAEQKLAELGITTVGELRACSLEELSLRFGRFGAALHRRARGIDERPVEPDQPVQSISAEDTFAVDVPLEELDEPIVRMAAKAWAATRKTPRIGHTVVLKLKTAQFRILTRSFTPEAPPASLEAFTRIALALRERVDLPADTRYRLVGVGLSGFREREEVAVQGALFDHDLAPAGDDKPAM